MIGWLLLLIGLFFLIGLFSKRHFCRIDDQSMEPVLMKGDRVIYRFDEIRRMDPVVYRREKQLYLGWAAGLPGDAVQVVQGKLQVNGHSVWDDPDTVYGSLTGKAPDPGPVPQDPYYFIIPETLNNAPFSDPEPLSGSVRRIPDQHYFVLSKNQKDLRFDDARQFLSWLAGRTIPRSQLGGRITRIVFPLSRRGRIR